MRVEFFFVLRAYLEGLHIFSFVSNRLVKF